MTGTVERPTTVTVRAHPVHRWRLGPALLALATLAALAPLGTAAGPVGATPPATCGPTAPATLGNGQTLPAGGCLVAPSAQYELRMQADGNLVLYYQSQADPLWASGTAGNAGAYAVMQADGNLVVYPAGGGSALWASNTAGTPSASLTMQADGNAVVYGTNTGGAPYAAWSSRTENLRGYQLAAGQLLQPGQYLSSRNGDYTLTMSPSGYLVLSETGRYLCPLWSEPAIVDYDPADTNRYPAVITYSPQDLVFSYDGNRPSYPVTGIASATPTTHAYLAMQADGNVVLYPPGNDGAALWATHTAGSGASLQMQTDGNLVEYSPAGAVLWSSGTDSYRGTALCTYDSLAAGQFLGFSSTKSQPAVTLTMQSDCNLVLYETSSSGSRTPIWASNTAIGTPDCHAVVQDDGNFVVYDAAGGPAWSSVTSIGATESPTGRPFVGPFWLGIYNPFLVLERWGAGAAWKADPESVVPTLSTTANSATGKIGEDVIEGVNAVLTNNYFNLQDAFEAVGWL